MKAVSVYGLSTEGYRIASALALKGVPTTIIDESLHMALQLKAETVRSYPTIEALTEDEALLGLQPVETAISESERIFFAPRIRRIGDDLKGELGSRAKEVARHLSRGSTLIYNLPASLGGNSENLELIEKVSGLQPYDDFNYIYAPIDSETNMPTIIGCEKSNLAKNVIHMLNMTGMKTASLTSLESAELIHFKYVVIRYCDFVMALETCRKIDERTIKARIMQLPGYKEIYLNELVANLLDLRLLSISLATGEPLLHVATGFIRSIEGYVRYLIDEIRNIMKSKEFKASKTKVAVVWSTDRYEMRGDRLQTLENLTEKLRDYVGETLNLGGKGRETLAQRAGWQDILLGGRASLFITCSNHDYEATSCKLRSSRSSADTALIKANLLCEAVQ